MTNELPTIEKQPPAPKAKKQVDAQLPVAMRTDAEVEASELEMEYEHYFSMADEMLLAINRENRKPTFAEQTFFKGRCGWDDREIQRQIGRMAAVLRSRAISGTALERQAAAHEQSNLAQILSVEGPKIQEQISKLQEQLASLERNSTRADRVVEQIGIAVENLRSVDLMRPDMKAEYHGKRREFGERDWTRLGAVGVEVAFRQQMLAPFYDPRKGLEVLRLHFPDCTKWDEGNRIFAVDNEKWAEKKRTMQVELIELTDEFDRLTAIKAEQLASLEPLRNFYLEEK